MCKKRVLLIAGGGTLGTYTAKELLRLGHAVDVVCREDKTSDCENLRYFKAEVSLDYLSDLFTKVRYDGIVNFLQYFVGKALYAKLLSGIVYLLAAIRSIAVVIPAVSSGFFVHGASFLIPRSRAISFPYPSRSLGVSR